MQIKKETKIPYLNRSIPNGATAEVIGWFRNEPEKIKVKFISVPKVPTEYPSINSGDVYGLNEDLFTD